MSRLRLVVLALAMIGTRFAFPATEPANNGDAMVGIWSSANLFAINQVFVTQECGVAVWRQRKVELRRVPGSPTAFRGEWSILASEFWVRANNGSCRWAPDEKEFRIGSFAVWNYGLEGVYDNAHNALHVHGQYLECKSIGPGCQQLMSPVSKENFATDLIIANGRLVDTLQTPDPSDDVQLLRVTDEADIVDEATSAFDAWTKLLDKGTGEQFFDMAASDSFKQATPKEQWKSYFVGVHNAGGDIVKRHNRLTLFALYCPFVSKDPGNYLWMINDVESTKGKQGEEYVFLVKEGAAWKVSAITYGP